MNLKKILMFVLFSYHLNTYAMGSKKVTLEINEVSVDSRILVMPVSLSDGMPKSKKWIYQIAENIAINDTMINLINQYKEIQVLPGEHALYENVIDALHDNSIRSDTKSIDLFVHLHGGEENEKGIISFYDYSYYTDTIEADIVSFLESEGQLTNQNINSKLRAVYSDSCYGSRSANNFLNASFRVADGAKEIDADGLTAYPAFLNEWKKNETYSSGIEKGNKKLIGNVIDLVGNIFSKTKIDSEKIIFGNPMIKITSNPNPFTIPETQSTVCAVEGEKCEFTGSQCEVAYGFGKQWVNKIYTNEVICENNKFGDPTFGVKKECHILKCEMSATGTQMAGNEEQINELMTEEQCDQNGNDCE